MEIHTIPTRIPSVQIIYDFVTPQEESFLLEHIDQVGGTTTGNTSNKNWGWKTLNGRRSMYWGGTILPNSNALIPTAFPKFMDGSWPNVLERIAETGVYDEYSGGKGKGKERGANHCLVNEYLSSQGILPHTDGPAYQPCTTTLSLGSHTILSLRSNPLSQATSSSSSSSPSPDPAIPQSSTTTEGATKNEEIDKLELFLPPRSLLILSSTLYSDYLHGIQPFEMSPIESLKSCANWDQWWNYLEGVEEETREGVEGLFEGQKEGGEREKAFEEFKKGLKDLNLLAETETREKGEEERKAQAQITEAQEEAEGCEEIGPKTPSWTQVEWIARVKEQKRTIEEGNGWKRSKRVSLTCRRVTGKVRDLSGLLGSKGKK
ncbi:uncharacterized protein JCM6883_000728 [Sporobolomyces salmoneus]|uniref:uncharacterized protein n=1 Tax=Sporobolomyces salmoneus TaxID=183962 RepID=UPI003172AE45